MDGTHGKSTEIRLAKADDQKELKEIWKLCFGDEESVINLYFETRDWIEETAVLLLEGRIVSMLTMIPVDIVDANGSSCSASMLFAIATHPGFQKQGLADRLIEFGNRHLLTKQTFGTLLVPAGEELFRFYAKRGYSESFFVRETILSREEIKMLAGSDRTECRLIPAEPAEYNNLRRKLLQGHPYLDYREDEISFQKRISQMFGFDLYTIQIGGVEGCFYGERISDEEVIVKELLLPEEYLKAALKQLSWKFQAEKYIIRTPAYCGKTLGGAVRPFGMIKNNMAEGEYAGADNCTVPQEYYLGIAYD